MNSLILKKSIEKHVELNDDEFQELINIASLRRYKKGQYIVHEGAVQRKTHFILNGAAIAFFIDSNGNEHVIQFAVEGWWISDIHCFVLNKPALFSVRVIEECELLEFSYDDLRRVYRKAPPIQSYFLSITQIAFASFQERTLCNLSMSAEDKYLKFVTRYSAIEKRFPQKIIASYLGISAAFFSKMKKKLLKK